MKAVINGVTVEGTPEEIAAYVKLASRAKSLAERTGPPRPGRRFDLTSRESQEAAKRLAELLSEVPNVNISPAAQFAPFCPAHTRFC